MKKILPVVGGYALVGVVGLFLGYILRPYLDKPVLPVCPPCPTTEATGLPDTAVIVYDCPERTNIPTKGGSSNTGVPTAPTEADSIPTTDTTTINYEEDDGFVEVVSEPTIQTSPELEQLFTTLRTYKGDAATKNGVVHYEHQVYGILEKSKYSITPFQSGPPPPVQPGPTIQNASYNYLFAKAGVSLQDSIGSYAGLLLVTANNRFAFEASYDWRLGLVQAGAGIRLFKWKAKQ